MNHAEQADGHSTGTLHAEPGRQLQAPIIILCCLHLLFLAAIAFVFPSPSVHLILPAVALGATFSYASLGAFWMAMGHWKFGWRVLTCGMIILFASLSIGAYAVRTNGPAAIGWITLGVCFVQCLLTQAPLWAVRLLGNWRVAHVDRERVSSPTETQFGIKNLLAWTAATAVLLGIARVSLPGDTTDRMGLEWAILCSFGAAFSMMLTLPQIWAGLANRRVAMWLLICLAYGAVITAVEAYIKTSLLAIAIPVGFTFMATMNITQALLFLGSLSVLRWQGYRLVQT